MAEEALRNVEKIKHKGRVKGYPVNPTDDMTGHGWRKELVWRDLKERNDKWFITSYHFTIDRFPCYNCKSSEFSWLAPQRTGIYKVCLGCQMATGPISMEDGAMIGSPKEISPEEAYGIFMARGLRTLIPKKLMKQIRRRRGKIKRGKVRRDIDIF